MPDSGYPSLEICSSLQDAANKLRLATAKAIDEFRLNQLCMFVLDGVSIDVRISPETGAVKLRHGGKTVVGRIPKASMIKLVDGKFETKTASAMDDVDKDTGFDLF